MCWCEYLCIGKSVFVAVVAVSGCAFVHICNNNCINIQVAEGTILFVCLYVLLKIGYMSVCVCICICKNVYMLRIFCVFHSYLTDGSGILVVFVVVRRRRSRY